MLDEISDMCFDLANDTLCPYCGGELQTETYNDEEILEYFGIPTSQEITVKYCNECEYSNMD